jgi:hypothetical protein
VIALAWGALVGLAVLRAGSGRRARRVGALVGHGRRPRRAHSRVAAAGRAAAHQPIVGAVVAVAGRPRARAARARRAEVPVLVELAAIAVAAGSTPRGALEAAADAAGPCRAALGRVVAAVGAHGLGPALEAGALEHPELARFLRALAAADASGAPLAATLSRLGRSMRLATRREAERRARTVPVRLLVPLVVLVLPAFALLTVVPAVLAGLP